MDEEGRRGIILTILFYVFFVYCILIIASNSNRGIAQLVWTPLVYMSVKFNRSRDNFPDMSLIGFMIRLLVIQILVVISSIILFSIIICFVIFKETLGNGFLPLRKLISNELSLQSQVLFVLIVFVGVFYVALKLYSWMIAKPIINKVFRFFLGGELEVKYVNKYLLTDFTVLIVFLGFAPFLLDMTEIDPVFIKEMKNLILWYFLFGLLPFVHLVYSSLK